MFAISSKCSAECSVFTQVNSRDETSSINLQSQGPQGSRPLDLTAQRSALQGTLQKLGICR